MSLKTERKKLIEVALPLSAINRESEKEKRNPFLKGHPRSLHQWWARRPLTSARAVIFAQTVEDPSSRPELFPTEAEQQRERERLFGIIRELVKWENGDNERVLQAARQEIQETWERVRADHTRRDRGNRAKDYGALPVFHDPFAGGGTLPLEAQRLGLVAHASDLNPVAVLINKAMIEIPPRFAGRRPVHDHHGSGAPSGPEPLIDREWKGAQGLAADVSHYGQWMRDEAERRIGHLYPKVQVTSAMVGVRPDLKPYEGRELTVIAWLWVRTVRSPNPVFADVEMPLASTWMLSTKKGKEAYVEPVIEGRHCGFDVRVGPPADLAAARRGTKSGGSGSSFLCMMSGSPMPFQYLRAEAKAGRMGSRLMAIVAQGDRGRVYLAPTAAAQSVARQARPHWTPKAHLPAKALGFRVQEYGMTRWRDLFTPRQLVALSTFSELVADAIQLIKRDALAAGLPDDDRPLGDGSTGARAYAEAVSVYLALAVSTMSDYCNTIATWNVRNENVRNMFSKQAIQMTWDFVEASPLRAGLALSAVVKKIADSLARLPAGLAGRSFQESCENWSARSGCSIVATDPPYYANVGYADLSDFFYVWLRRVLKTVFPDVFATLMVPKDEELVANPFRHGGKKGADRFFLDGMTNAMGRLAENGHVDYPIVVYYAARQTDKGRGGTKTDWETFLEAIIGSGLRITGTWPVRTERETRSVALGTNALASSIVLVCRRRREDSPLATRREFVRMLRDEMPRSLMRLQSGGIAPVDLAQAAIGPGMAIYTRYTSVLNAEGGSVSVGEALGLINQTVDEILTEREGEFDRDTRWALAWFEEYGFETGPFGVAETLSKAKNTRVGRMEEDGFLKSSSGKVRLLRPTELSADWNPVGTSRLTSWQVVHHLIRILESEGESAVAGVLRRLGGVADVARDLAYRLYSIAERKKRAAEALQYNSLVGSWVEIKRMASAEAPAEQTELL